MVPSCVSRFYLFTFTSNQKGYSLQANVMIIQSTLRYLVIYDVVWYSYSDVTSGAL